MNRTIALVLTLLAAVTLACGPVTINIPRVTVGPTETITINESKPDVEAVEVTVKMAAGKLTLQSGAEGLVEGTIDYNVAAWEPTITNKDGRLDIIQGSDTNGVTDGNVVNDWDLKLGTTPMSLTLTAGAYEGTIDLSGLRLQAVDIHDGASQAEVTFTEPNEEVMSHFNYQTGASQVTLKGLAYANFEEMEFKGGAGDFTLDFTGELQRDAEVSVDVGVCSLEIIVPDGMNVEVKVDGGVKSVETEGTWNVDGDDYSLSGDGPKLTIRVDMGVGSLKLVKQTP